MPNKLIKNCHQTLPVIPKKDREKLFDTLDAFGEGKLDHMDVIQTFSHIMAPDRQVLEAIGLINKSIK